ncbi:MAG: serine/threonine protein kinase [Ignavibacteriae bacterium]|nr:serine/threonine protein kinase [Ignavibacteriota bacterium]
MTPKRWQQVKELFTSAKDLSADERERFLDAHIAGDAELRSEVESLLASYSEGDDEAGFAPTQFWMADDSSLLGKNIGAYTIVREIARGGMGVVYEGRRETEFKQRVAIKLIRSGLGTEDTVRRFHAERSALARLNHPNIAKLLDGGSLPDARLLNESSRRPDGQGTPYFVMEYVDGIPIDAYCDEKKLSIHDRLQLYRTVCAAVQYAHQNLIVHRDLKPGNIFATPTGVKLLDFGIAKLLSPDMSDDMTQTQNMQRFFTPEYASPEQILGAPVTTSSDIYSLGVLLYKLLTGQRPYQIKTATPRDLEQAILENEPTKPSSVVSRSDAFAAENRSTTTLKLAKTLSGDLDTIVLKALQKEPERRYASVQQLDEDLRRYLAGRPVAARKDSFGYRFSKFVRRNQIAVAAFVIVNLVIIGGIGGVIWQGLRAERERDRAQAESEKAQEVIRVLNEMLSAADVTRATKKDVTVAEILDQASQRIERDFANRPELAADLLSTIGSTYESLQLFDKAEAAKRKVLELQRQLRGSDHPKVAEALHALGEIHYMRENRAVAESLFSQSLAIFHKHAEPSKAYALMLNDYGVFVQDEGKYTLADSLLLSALKIYHEVPGDNRKDIATSLHNLALSKDWQGKYQEADSLYRVSLAIQREVYGNNNVLIAFTIGNLGYIAEARKDYTEAERLFRESLAIRRSMLSENHSDLAASKIKLGIFLVEHGTAFAEAERLCREALDALMQHNPNLKRLLARAHLGIGQALHKQRKIHEAENDLRIAVAYFMQTQPLNPRCVADAQITLAENLLEQHRDQESETQILQAQKVLHSASADSSAEMVRSKKVLEYLCAARKKVR